MRIALGVAGVVCVVVACSALSTDAQEGVGISIRDFAFEPRTMGVGAGTTVRWVNHDDGPHNVTMLNRQPGSSGVIRPGALHTFTFRSAGRFSYRCAMHPTMLGEVVVTDP
jgi:plastocyanin